MEDDCMEEDCSDGRVPVVSVNEGRNDVGVVAAAV